MKHSASNSDHADLVEAALALLGETAWLLNEVAQPYIVVGGWSPFLRNCRPLPHPGTRDVDVLFKAGAEKGALKVVVDHFLAAGFLVSAKHPFQLLRVLRVRGTEFVFNVDLLHPGESAVKPEMFVDHLELPVPLSKYRDDSFTIKSIVIPGAEFLFDGHFETYDLKVAMPAGASQMVPVPLMTEIGVLTTKADSSSAQKRPRDSLDIFLAIEQARDYGRLVEGLRTLKAVNRPAFNTLYGIRAAMDDAKFCERVSSQLEQIGKLVATGTPSSNQVRMRMDAFFSEVGLDQKAFNV
jgi:hypothetical protein